MNTREKIEFKNTAPEDKEWTAHVNLLNKYTDPERYLREIIIYARSGKHYPTDMHVDLVEQVIAEEVKVARINELKELQLVDDESNLSEYGTWVDQRIFERLAELNKIKVE